MLELKNIKKIYSPGMNEVHALKGIDLKFRKSDFVSILGPSGCGKTTMLNIIGGLDQYTEGDLVINGRSTKDYKDRDWDSYRNHTIGFVFQSYNLIPHQSVLQNVELALTLSGVSKRERRKRAKEALEQVGLGDQIKKKPSEMSGGQMQRVAIARALVNNPDIILADEPTGALDTETSIQVMEILKEVSKDRLVIMVTHNPDIAEKYSTRIIRMLDGVITSDSAPLSEEEVTKYTEENKKELDNNSKKKKKPSMSLWTGFSLSLNNLFTKKGRTMLTAFAGSIGIIGIALIFAVSNGMTNYIDALQEDTLSSYPLTIEATNVDISTVMQTFMGVESEANKKHEKDAVYSQPVLLDMINALNNMESSENDLKSFKKHIEKEIDDQDSDLEQALSGVQYTYDFDLLVFTKNIDGKIIESNAEKLLMKAIQENMGMDMSVMLDLEEDTVMGSMMDMEMSMMSNSGMGNTNIWTEMLSGKDGSLISPVLEKQYDVIYGSWPNSYNEIALVVDENNEVDDMTLYALGLKSEDEVNAVFDAVLDGTEVESKQEKWTYEELCDMTFRVVLNSSCFTYDEVQDIFTDLRETDAGMRYLYKNGIDIKISGIIRPNEEATSSMLSGTLAYTKDLTEYIVKESKKSDAVKAQLENKEIDIFSGNPFNENTGNLTNKEKEKYFRQYIEELDEEEKAETYIKILSTPTKEELDQVISDNMDGLSRKDMEERLITSMVEQMGMNEEEVTEYVEDMSDEEIDELFEEMITEGVKMQMQQQVLSQTAMLTPAQLSSMLENEISDYTRKECALYYDEVLEFSENTYDSNLRELGYVNLNNPSSINLFASSFENKDVIEESIAKYNEGVDELKEIKYTDYVGIMMSSVTSIINAITYVLIAFVAISLIVSSIMIGVITLISVQERTKEIGILRAIGASKKNVSNMFNAETVIVGFSAGLLGVVVTYLMCIPINIILYKLTNISALKTHLPIEVAIALILISVILTLIAGIIPSRSAAKKDPVVALRTE